MTCKDCAYFVRYTDCFKNGYCKMLSNVLEFEYPEYNYNSTTPVKAIIVPEDFSCNQFENTIDNLK